MQILILILTLLLAAPAIAQKFPIRNGVLQTDLNAAGHYITNAAGITDAAGNPLAGISVAQGTNIVLVTNGSVVTVNGTGGGGSVPAGIITNGQSGVTLSGAFNGNGIGMTNVVATLTPSIEILRGTNRISVDSWETLTNTWLAGDTIELGATNWLDRDIEVTKPGITIQGRGVNSSFVGTITNRFEIRASDLTFQNFTIFAVIPPEIAYGNANYPAIGYFGKEDIGNILIQNLRADGPYSAVTMTGTNLSAFQGYVTNVIIRDCDFTGYGSWNGANIKFDRWDTNSTALVQRCTLTHTSLARGTNVQMYGSLNIRAQQGFITVEDCFLKSIGYVGVTNYYLNGETFVREQIGVYLQNADLTVDGNQFDFDGQGPQPAGAIFREGGNLTIRGAGVASQDIHNNGTTYGGYTSVGNDAKSIGTTEIEVVGTNGISVLQYGFRDMPFGTVTWAVTNRNEWFPLMSAFYNKSNTFNTIAAQTNTVVNYTNGDYILSFWATNGIIVTNAGTTTNFILAAATGDALFVSNTGPARLGGLALRTIQMDTNFVVQSADISSTDYSIWTYDYVNGGRYLTNYPYPGGKAIYSPSNIAYAKILKTSPGTRRVGVWLAETFAADGERKLRVELDASRPITNGNIGAISVSANQLRTFQNTNAVYVTGPGFTASGGTHTWSGASYTNHSGPTRYITNVGGFWQIVSGTIRYTNNNLLGQYSLGVGAAPAPFVVPSGWLDLNGSLIVTNGTITIFAAGVQTFGQNGTFVTVGGVTNNLGGPLTQAAHATTNTIQASRFLTNTVNAGLSIQAQGSALVEGSVIATNFIWSKVRWVDALASGLNLAVNPAQSPDLVALPGASLAFGMAYAHGEEAYFSIQSPHVLASTNHAAPYNFTNFYYEPHIHVSPTSVAGGTNITFRMEWQEAIVGGNFTNVLTYLRTNTVTVTNVNQHAILSFGNVTNNALQGRSSVIFRGAIERLASAAGDVGATQIVILDSVDFHLPVRVFGSATQTSDE